MRGSSHPADELATTGLLPHAPGQELKVIALVSRTYGPKGRRRPPRHEPAATTGVARTALGADPLRRTIRTATISRVAQM
jgi:hypothetical protein